MHRKETSLDRRTLAETAVDVCTVIVERDGDGGTVVGGSGGGGRGGGGGDGDRRGRSVV